MLGSFIAGILLACGVWAIRPSQNLPDESFLRMHGLELPRYRKTARILKPDAQEAERLDPDVWPLHYDLELQVFVPSYDTNFSSQFDYTTKGRISILVNVSKATNKIELHHSDLIHVSQFSLDSNERHLTTNDTVKEKKVFSDGRTIGPGLHTLKIEFSGSVIEYSKGGIFKESYTNFETGKRRVIVATQMEAPYTRDVFPCFDEPALKATWNITIIHPANSIATSNAPLANKQVVSIDNDEWLKSSFKQTPVMPPYVVAIVIHDYVYTETKTARGLTIGIWVPKGKENFTSFSLNVLSRGMDAMEKLLDIQYPLDKLDVFPLPKFNGAMENFGLMIHDQDTVLLDDSVATSSQRRSVLYIVLHELSHQWFGNLVTAKWWDDIWLNESFATFFGKYLSTELFPQLHTDLYDRFKSEEIALSMPASKSISSSVSSTIMDSFEHALVYTQGSRVVLIFRKLVGDEAFFKAFRLYLKKFAFKSVESADLLECFVNVLDKKLGAEMTHFYNQWIYRPGFPVFKLHADYRLEQILNASEISVGYKNVSLTSGWPAVISAHTGYEDDNVYYARFENASSVMVFSPNVVPMINMESKIFARVLYDESLFVKLVAQYNKIHDPSHRLQLLADLFYSADKYEKSFYFTHLSQLQKDEKDSACYLAFFSFGELYSRRMHKRSYLDREPCGYLCNEKTDWNHILRAMNDADATEYPDYSMHRNISHFKNECAKHRDECNALLFMQFEAWLREPCSTPTSIISQCSRIPENFKREFLCAVVANGEEDFLSTRFENEVFHPETSFCK